MTARFYTFAKRENSTQQPTGIVTPTNYEIEFNTPFSLINPTIVLNLGLVANPVAFNYCYVLEFNRFYFVSDWVFDRGLWTANAVEDCLASWRSDIGAASEYILRSSAAYNANVIDTLYPANSVIDVTEAVFQQGSPWSVGDIRQGVFIIGIVGTATTYYAFNSTNLTSFLTYLFSTSYADAVFPQWATVKPDMLAELNPTQFISSIMWFPFIPSTIFTSATPVTQIKVGWVDVACVAWELPDNARTTITGYSIDLTAYRHPQSSRGNYLNLDPYTTITLFFPPFGNIPISAALAANSTSMSFDINVDLRTGSGTLTLVNNDADVCAYLHAQIGVNYQISQVVNRQFQSDTAAQLSIVSSVGKSAAAGAGIGAAAGTVVPGIGNAAGAVIGGIGGAIAGLMSAIGDAGERNISKASTIGVNGSIDGFIGIPKVIFEYKRIVDEDNTHRGRPLCEVRTISTIPGFIMVADPDISIPATADEIRVIKQYMSAGFYYE